MSIRSIMAMLIAAPILAVAGGGIVLNPGSGWQVSRSSAPYSLGWTDPYLANLIGLWRMDPLWTNTATTIPDYSGWTNSLTIRPNLATGPAWIIGVTNDVVGTNFGRVDHFAEFDGSDDYLFASPVSSTLKPTEGITIAAWIRPDSMTTGSSTSKTICRLTGNYRMYFYQGSGSPALEWYIDTVNIYLSWPTNQFTIGQWVHIAGTYNRTNQVLYVNGVAVTNISATNAIGTTGTEFSVGVARSSGSPVANSYFDGGIDDIRIYNIGLPASAILDVYANTIGRNENGY